MAGEIIAAVAPALIKGALGTFQNKPATPEPVAPTPAPAIPVADQNAAEQKRKQALIAQQRGGRASTILSTNHDVKDSVLGG